jgi:hypothetical protein
MPRAHYTNMQGLMSVLPRLAKDLEATGHLDLQWSNKQTRSQRQNALYAVWVMDLVKAGRGTADDVRAFCKLHFGVPILRADSIEFRELYDSTIKRLEYPRKLALMRHISITSAMNTEQMARFLTSVQDHYASLTTDPVFLESPDDSLNHRTEKA